jgi:hypothetical protein
MLDQTSVKFYLHPVVRLFYLHVGVSHLLQQHH